jgi:ABC-type lipoprotein release transport system permease subunit
MAIATAAIICVLSVFNGFREVIGGKLDSLSPDLMVSPVKGKVFADADNLADRITQLPGVQVATPTLSDKALLICNSREMPVTLKGVLPDDYAKVTSIRSLIKKDYGEYITEESQTNATVQQNGSGTLPQNGSGAPPPPPRGVASIGAAARLQTYPGDGGLLFAPRREGRVNLANPAASFYSDSIRISGIYRSDQSQYDEDGLIVPLDLARSLFMYDTEASAIEIKLAPEANADATQRKVAEALGAGFTVKNRLQQQAMNFRMIAIEKWVSFLLLTFILIIAGFNIISSLSMLVIEKEEAIHTIRALGMSRRRIGSIFAWESIYVSMAGAAAGIILGVGLCLAQQHFGLIKIAGDAEMSILQAYPVKVQWPDILATLAISAILAATTALITAAFARSKCRHADIK